MIFKRIDESTVRCIITEEDMEENGLELDDFFTQSEKVQEFLREIVEQAGEEVGYESKQGMVSLQIMPLPNHGLAITFSEKEPEGIQSMVESLKEMLQDVKERVEAESKGTLREFGSDEKENAGEDAAVVEKKLASGKDSDEKEKQQTGEKLLDGAAKEPVTTRMFAFVNLRFAMQFARTIQEKKPILSTLYKDAENNVYYMTIEKGRLSSKKYNYICTNATEFSTYVADGSRILDYLKEHGEVVIDKRAMKVLARI